MGDYFDKIKGQINFSFQPYLEYFANGQIEAIKHYLFEYTTDPNKPIDLDNLEITLLFYLIEFQFEFYKSGFWKYKVSSEEIIDENAKIEEIISDTSVFNLLIEAGANVNFKNKEGYTALDIIGLGYNHTPVKDFLLRSGAKHSQKYIYEHNTNVFNNKDFI